MGSGRGLKELCDNFLEHITIDVSEFAEATTLKAFQLLIIKAHMIQEGGVDVTNMERFPNLAQAEFIGLARCGSGFHVAMGNPRYQLATIVIAAGVLAERQSNFKW